MWLPCPACYTFVNELTRASRAGRRRHLRDSHGIQTSWLWVVAGLPGQGCDLGQPVHTHSKAHGTEVAGSLGMPGPHPRMLRPRYPVRSERLLLRPLAVGDVDALLAYRSREDVCRYEPLSRDETIERIAGQWARTELTDEGQWLTLGIQVGETGELAGDVGLIWRSRAHAGGELGYAFNPALGGRGYATEAADVMASRFREAWPASHRDADG